MTIRELLSVVDFGYTNVIVEKRVGNYQVKVHEGPAMYIEDYILDRDISKAELMVDYDEMTTDMVAFFIRIEK